MKLHSDKFVCLDLDTGERYSSLFVFMTTVTKGRLVKTYSFEKFNEHLFVCSKDFERLGALTIKQAILALDEARRVKNSL